ncbi:MAG: thioredoxin family protein [Bacteroidia bacterium]
MKRISILTTALLALIVFGFKPANDEIKWLDFNTGYNLAQKKGKIMIVDVYTDWCGWCKKMDRDAYAKEEISKIVNSDFIPVKFNPEITGVVYKFEGKEYTGEQLAGVISNYQISGYPTTIFLYPKEKKSEIVVGYKNAEQLKPILEDMKKKYYTKK